jgi:hypothetical protein
VSRPAPAPAPEVIRLIPGFIVEPARPADDAPPPSRRYGGEAAEPGPRATAYVPQQNEMLPPDNKMLGITSFQCPGCYTVRCGFLGHSTCLVCC